MRQRLRSHLSYANVVSTLCLFLLLGGTAAALDGSNTVFTDDIVDSQVKNADLGDAAVTAGKIGADQVTSAKIAGGGVGTADIADTAVTRPKLGPDSVNASKVANDSLTGADVNLTLPQGFSTDPGVCDVAPANPNWTNCATVHIVLAHSHPLLIVGNGVVSILAFDDPADVDDEPLAAFGECRLKADGSFVGQSVASLSQTTAAGGTVDESFSLLGIVTLGAGSHTIKIACTETDGDVGVSLATLAAVELGT
jgi:hypothetical protein